MDFLTDMKSEDDVIKIAKAALRKFGPAHQMQKCAEELLELSVELAMYRKTGNREVELIDEIADVWFTTFQVASHVGLQKVLRRLRVKALGLDLKMHSNPQQNGKAAHPVTL